MLQVLYEDNHVIAVVKPSGLLVQADISGEECLMDLVKEYLKNKYHKKGNVFLGLVHRLDRNVSGIVVLAKTSKGASRLSEQFRNHTVTKVYTALVEGKISKNQHLTHYLVKDSFNNQATVYEYSVPGAKLAELDLEVIRPGDSQSLVKIILGTGRSHQIRAQLAHIGQPIVGDVKYGSIIALKDQSIALAATELRFMTATTNQGVVLHYQPVFITKSN